MKRRTNRGWVLSQDDQASTALVNPRPPAVPASLKITIEEYYAAAALMGLLSSLAEQPEMNAAAAWAFEMGVTMAAESKRRRDNGTAGAD